MLLLLLQTATCNDGADDADDDADPHAHAHAHPEDGAIGNYHT